MAANVMGLGVVAAIADGVASSMVTVDELAAHATKYKVACSFVPSYGF